MFRQYGFLIPVGVLVAGLLLSTDATLATQQIPPGGFDDARVDLDLDAAFALLRKFEVGQSRQPINFIEHEVYKVTNDPSAVAAMRDRLLAALEDPHSTYMCRKLICHNWLPLLAGDEAVPALVNMLGDQHTGLLAIDALQRIGGEASTAALRAALSSTSGSVRLMAIQAVGQRGDEAAGPTLIRLAKSDDIDTRGCALSALGAIGSSPAAAELLQMHAGDEGTLAEARLQCAERRLLAGDRQMAARLCQTVLAGPKDTRVCMAALTGLAEALGTGALPQLRAALGGGEPLLTAHVTELLANLPGAGATTAILDLLDGSTVAQRAALLRALGRRGDQGALDHVASYVHAEDPELRVAAIEAVGQLGDASMVDLLFGIAASQQGETQRAARAALITLRDDAVDQRVCTLLDESEAAVKAEAIRIAVGRQMTALKPRLLGLTKHESAVVRAAAYEFLRELVGADDYDAAIQLAVDTPFADDRPSAVQLIRAAGRHINDTSARTTPLLAAMERADATAQAALLPLLTDIGSEAIPRQLVERLSSTNDDLKDAAVRTLADWPNRSALPYLLRVVRESANSKHRILATRGYLRLFPEAEDPVAAVNEILPMVPDEEKPRLVSGLARAEPSPALLRLATELLEDPSIQAETSVAIERIAAALVEQQPDVVLAVLARVRARTSNARTPAGLTEIELTASALSRNIHERIDPGMPNGYRLACYLNAGAATVAADPGGATIRQLRGQSYRYTPERDPTTVVAFDPQHVEFELAGLTRDRRYMLGVTWWDVDNNGRIQSIAVAPADSEQWLSVWPKTRPVAYHADQATYAVLHLPLGRDFTEAGRLRVRIQREGPSNVVVSELWLVEQPHTEQTPRRIALVTGDDYPGHRWRETAPELASIFREDPRFEVTIIESPAIFGSPLLDYFDAVIVHFKNYHARMPTDQAQCDGLAEYVRSGGGLIVAHFGCGAFQEWDGYVKLAGRVWDPQLRGHDPHGPFVVHVVDREHPITKHMSDFKTTDELYTCLAGDTPIHTLCDATSSVDERDYPVAFTLQLGMGRVFHCPLGHDVNAFKARGTRALYRCGAAWVVGIEPNATD